MLTKIARGLRLFSMLTIVNVGRLFVYVGMTLVLLASTRYYRGK